MTNPNERSSIKHLHILHNNSLPKIDEIRLIAKQSNPSIIRISKSKLHTSILNSAVATEDYDLIRIGQSGRRSYMLYTFFISNAYAIYLFKVNNRNTRTRREICSKLTIKTPEWRQWLWTYFKPCSTVSIVNFEQVIPSWEHSYKQHQAEIGKKLSKS